MKITSHHGLAALFAGCASCALLAAPAVAQDAAPPTPAAATDANDIIVTAQRRSERLESVPISIVAASQATLERSGITRFQDIGNIAPAVQISRAGAFVQPAIRGVSTLTAGQGYENNVALYVDGFYQPDTISINGDLVNISDLQVLKGPQGTLYGRNATAGALLVTTPDPSRTWTGNMAATYARFDDKRGQIYLSGPLSDNLAFNIAGYIRRSPGYIKDIKGQFDPAPLEQSSIRAKLAFKPSDALRFVLSYVYNNSQDARTGLFASYANTPALVSGTTIPYPNPPIGARYDYVVDITRPTNVRTIAHQIGLLSEWETGIGKLSSHTSYFHKQGRDDFDFDGVSQDASWTIQNGHENNFQQSLDLAVNKIDWVDLLVGASYYYDRYNTLQIGTSYGNYANVQHYGQTSNSFAGYADATFKPMDKLFITLGGRYTHEDKDGHYYFDPGNTGAALPLPAFKSTSFSAFTPRGVIRYELAPRTSVYASISQGFRTGTFPLTIFTDPRNYNPIKSEKITSYEIGFKTAGRLIRFDASAYLYNFKNLQVGLSVPNPLAPTNIISQVINAPKAKVYGVEGGVTYTPTRELTIRASAAWTHARYTDFPNATGTGLNAATNLNITGQAQDWSGQQMARAPSFTANLGGSYKLDTKVGGIEFSANGSYTTSFVLFNPSLYGPLAGADLANKQRFRQPAYALLNAQIEWTDTTGHMSVAFFGNNLTDKRYYLVSSGGAFGSYRQYAEPITYGVKVGYKF